MNTLRFIMNPSSILERAGLGNRAASQRLLWNYDDMANEESLVKRTQQGPPPKKE